MAPVHILKAVAYTQIDTCEVPAELAGQVMTAIPVIKFEYHVRARPPVQANLPLIEVILVTGRLYFLIAGIKTKLVIEPVTGLDVPTGLFVGTCRLNGLTRKIPMCV